MTPYRHFGIAPYMYAYYAKDLTDAQLRTLADAGGVVGVNFYDEFLGDRGGMTAVEDIIRHLLYLRDRAGIESLAFGSDFDGILLTPSGLENIARSDSLWEELRRRGYTQAQIDQISGGNLMEVYKRVIKYSE